jgi:hypothetical protein
MTDQPLSPAAQALAAAFRAAARLNPGPCVPELFGEGWDAAMGALADIATELGAMP